MKTMTKYYCGCCIRDINPDDMDSADICPYCGCELGGEDVQEEEKYTCTLCDSEYDSKWEAARCERDCRADFRYRERRDEGL